MRIYPSGVKILHRPFVKSALPPCSIDKSVQGWTNAKSAYDLIFKRRVLSRAPGAPEIAYV